MSGCLADVAAALVDGELDDAAREKAHRHLAHCAACRAEVDQQRRLKARLSQVDAPAPSAALTSRLLRLDADPRVLAAAPTVAAMARGAAAPAAARPDSFAHPPRRPPTGPFAAARPAGRSSAGRAVRRRAAASSAFALLGVTAALALGGPPQHAVPQQSVPTSTGGAFVPQVVRANPSGTGRLLSPVPALRAGTGTPVPFTGGALLTTVDSGARR